METPYLTTLIILSIFGVLDAGYLSWSHFFKKTLICPLESDCRAVTESRWSNIFGIRNDYLGLVYYFSVLIIAISSLFLSESSLRLFKLVLIMTAGGAFFSVFLVGVQIFSIKQYCLYCIASALISVLLLINAIALVI